MLSYTKTSQVVRFPDVGHGGSSLPTVTCTSMATSTYRYVPTCTDLYSCGYVPVCTFGKFSHVSLRTSSGILTTWHKRVQICLYHVCTVYIQCYSTSADINCIYISQNVYTCMYMFIYLGKCIYTSVHGIIVCTS